MVVRKLLEGQDIKSELVAAVPELRLTDCHTFMTRNEATDTTHVMIGWKDAQGDVHTQKVAVVNRGLHPLDADIDPNFLNILRVRVKLTLCL